LSVSQQKTPPDTDRLAGAAADGGFVDGQSQSTAKPLLDRAATDALDDEEADTTDQERSRHENQE
jgi:hypothetical protein